MNQKLRTLFSKRVNLPGPQVDLPPFREIVSALASFSPKKQLIFLLAGMLGVAALAAGLVLWLGEVTVEVPAPGGELIEGIIGSPRFINPLLATSDADRDLTALIYSGLVRPDEDGGLRPDLAESYTVSDDGLIYTFVLKPDLKWHDGQPLTAEDIEFTIGQVKNPQIKSSKRAGFEGVEVEVVDESMIRFVLRQPYAPFLENASLGIIPKHLWKDISTDEFPFSDLNNEKSVGSGPYQIKSVRKNKFSVPTIYQLKPFRHFALGQPFMNLEIKFYSNEQEIVQALNAGDITNASAISPATVTNLNLNKTTVYTSPLLRIFGVFFNQNHAPVLAIKEVRNALDRAIDRKQLIDNVLVGYGTVLNGPIPSGSRRFQSEVVNNEDDTGSAETILKLKGWEKAADGIYQRKTKTETVRLAFDLVTGNVGELKAAADFLATAWRALGAEVNLQVFELGDLNQNVIRPRRYDALLFGEVFGRDPDPFPFWHSSQRLDPGLNISLYANIAADKLLEEARAVIDPQERFEKYLRFQEEIRQDTPAIFIYAPTFIYLAPSDIKEIELPPIVTPADRFANVYKWHKVTDQVWPIFAN